MSASGSLLLILIAGSLILIGFLNNWSDIVMPWRESDAGGQG
jgi:hypothetical protein